MSKESPHTVNSVSTLLGTSGVSRYAEGDGECDECESHCEKKNEGEVMESGRRICLTVGC